MSARILVIEDNEQNLYLMRFLLGKHGFEVVEAQDGAEGIRLAREVNPSQVFQRLEDAHRGAVGRDLGPLEPRAIGEEVEVVTGFHGTVDVAGLDSVCGRLLRLLRSTAKREQKNGDE